MSTKVIQVSPTGAGTYAVIPGNSGSYKRDGAIVDDSIFGQSFNSSFTSLISWSVDANAYYKGYAGYEATIKQVGTSTAAAGEAMTLVTGKQYQITSTTKRIWDRSVAVVVYDNAIDHTADVLSIDYLFGQVIFKTAYTPTGPITVDINYYPTSAIGKAQKYTLTQTAATIDTTDFATAQANGGFMTADPGLRTVSIELNGVYDAVADFESILTSRAELIIEINPDGAGLSLARGFFRLSSDQNSGNLGALENEALSFVLSVPESVYTPFAWAHDALSTIPTAIKYCLDAWQNETKIDVQYLPDGVSGRSGTTIVTDISVSGELNGINEFTINLEGDGATAAV